jgi:hypothetical protein
MASTADILRALKNSMMTEAFFRHGAIAAAAGRENLSDSFSAWRPKAGGVRLCFWFNLPSGTTKMIDRALPADLVDLVDARGNLVNKEAA